MYIFGAIDGLLFCLCLACLLTGFVLLFNDIHEKICFYFFAAAIICAIAGACLEEHEYRKKQPGIIESCKASGKDQDVCECVAQRKPDRYCVLIMKDEIVKNKRTGAE